MKIAKFRFGRMATAGALVVGSLFIAQAALACTVGNWSDNSGNLTVGGPSDGVARYSGLCALETPEGAVSFVQDNNPGGIGQIIARFYVLANNTSEAVVYRGLNARGSPIFGVRVNPSSGDVTLTSAGTSAVCSVCANIGKWNSIEIDWNGSDGQLILTVNTETPVSVPFSTSTTVHSARLGNLNGAAGTLNFDAYESRRSTAVGRLLRGDANGSGVVNIADASAIIAELGDKLQAGQPDCNESGVVNIADASCVVALL